MIVRVEANGLRCWGESFRYTSAYYTQETVLLSMFGDRYAVRAAWALFFEKKRYPTIQVGGLSAMRRENTAYTTVQTPIGKGQLHIIIVDVRATRQGSSFGPMFYQVGPNAETRYFQRFTHQCPIPMRPSWRDDLWSLGLEKGAIAEVHGFGIPVFGIKTGADSWTPIIQEALTSGRLS